MSYTITQESWTSLASCWVESSRALPWRCLFVLPAWLKVWWQELGSGGELYLGVARDGEKIIGMAPLLVQEQTAAPIGSADVCDYLDFVVAPGREKDFFTIILDDLARRGIHHLDLGLLRPDSTILTHLVDIARNRGYAVLCQAEDVSLELDLPADWENYLAILAAKQRHEVRRKLRKLAAAGEVRYHFITDSAAVPRAMDTFLKMFTESRQEKTAFLTARREAFLRSLAQSMAEIGLLTLGVLELDALPVAMIMCFDYNGCVYLYNSGYDTRYSSLSVGLLGKILGIKESIQAGKKKFDFLKGSETYKYDLGGREVPLSRCQISIK